ncbi:hypothetical protein evm_009289 [Chilo suppressalis]|nr:hypothetical protein evm_009289 [Chilo suppressalis]
MADEADERASGDVVSQEKAEVTAPDPEPPKVPDVELTVDGFGFMPKSAPRKSRTSKDSDKSLKNVKEHEVPGTEYSSPCVSSTNIDIVRRYTWKTKNRMNVQVITYGATITAIKVPDKKGVPDDILAGFDTLEEYFQPRNPYFGSTIGRYANYIRDATMVVEPSGGMYMLSPNKGGHHYHGGHVGFDKVNWRSYITGNKVIMSHVSERFHEGYPGTVMVQVAFEVTCENTLKIEMRCTTSEPTIVNMSNMPYFNLAGHHSGTETMFDHIITINADKYTVVDDDGLVTGKVVKVLHPLTGRVLEVYSNQPGMQFYTGNLLPDPDRIVEMEGEEGEEGEDAQGEKESESESEESESEKSSAREEEEQDDASEGKRSYGYVPLFGKGGALYKKHGFFCLMPQNYPDAINHKNFPNSVLNPGETYVHKIQYKFGLLLGRYV